VKFKSGALHGGMESQGEERAASGIVQIHSGMGVLRDTVSQTSGQVGK
jgi:hypothetical protein